MANLVYFRPEGSDLTLVGNGQTERPTPTLTLTIRR